MADRPTTKPTTSRTRDGPSRTGVRGLPPPDVCATGTSRPHDTCSGDTAPHKPTAKRRRGPRATRRAQNVGRRVACHHGEHVGGRQPLQRPIGAPSKGAPSSRVLPSGQGPFGREDPTAADQCPFADNRLLGVGVGAQKTLDGGIKLGRDAFLLEGGADNPPSSLEGKPGDINA